MSLASAIQGYQMMEGVIRDRRGYNAARKEFGDGPASSPELFSTLNQERRLDRNQERLDSQETRTQESHDLEMDTTKDVVAEDGMLKFVNGLRKARDNGDDIGHAFDQMSSVLPNLGVDPEALPDLRKEVIENPALLDQLHASLSTGKRNASGSGLTAKQQLDLEQSIQKEAQAKESITKDIVDMGNMYRRLDELGGIQNIDDNWMGRLGRSASQSWVGQTIGQMRGTEEAQLRQSIKARRTGLIAAMKQAGDLGSKMFDSNKDMEMWLENLSSPDTNIQTALQQLESFNDKFGRALNGEEVQSITVDDIDWSTPPANYTTPETSNVLYPGMVDEETGAIFVGPNVDDWKMPGEE